MKIITKDEEKAHYNSVLRGGAIGGALGLTAGMAGVTLASRRYATFRNLTLPFRAFLVTSATTFGGIVVAERNSINFARARDPMYLYKDESQRELASARAAETGGVRALDWARDNRYTIVLTSWAAAIGVAIALVGRNKYLTTAQKLVQARVYAQGLTLAVLLATGALEVSDAKSGKGSWETVMVLDPNDPEHKHLIEKRIHKEEYEGQDLWKGEHFLSFSPLPSAQTANSRSHLDMVAAEERRLSAQKKQREENNKVGAPAQS